MKAKPCPFCGSSRVECYETWRPNFRIECEKCGASGPLSASDADAVEWWNEAPRRRGDSKLHARRIARLQTGYRKAKRALIRQEKAAVAAKAKAEHKDRQWARDREAWLRAPIEMINERWSPDRDDQ